MFNWDFAKWLFNGFMILRWTDFFRPTEFVQIEKSAEQSMLTYLIGKEYEEANKDKPLDWEYIVDNNIYSFLCKLATSDIKATISKQLKKEHSKKLSEFIIDVYFDKDGNSKYQASIDKQKLEDYFNPPEEDPSAPHFVENQICYIAHKMATFFEFRNIEPLNRFSPDLYSVRKDLSIVKIEDHVKDSTLKDIVNKLGDSTENIAIFVSYLEKLRPQIRWSQTCRLPLTTVLGHSMYVATLTYFAIKDLGEQRDAEKYLVDSFYCALFHDLPESLTRDIISPVKRNIEGFEDKLSSYEYAEVEKRYISRIESKKWKDDLLKLLGLTPEKKFTYDSNRDAILGKLVKKMDLLAAFMEAKMSVEIGVDSKALQEGIKNTVNALEEEQEDLLPDDLKCERIHFAEFFASIPQFKQGV